MGPFIHFFEVKCRVIIANTHRKKLAFSILSKFNLTIKFMPNKVLLKYPELHKIIYENQNEIVLSQDLYHSLNHILTFPVFY